MCCVIGRRRAMASRRVQRNITRAIATYCMSFNSSFLYLNSCIRNFIWFSSIWFNMFVKCWKNQTQHTVVNHMFRIERTKVSTSCSESSPLMSFGNQYKFVFTLLGYLQTCLSEDHMLLVIGALGNVDNEADLSILVPCYIYYKPILYSVVMLLRIVTHSNPLPPITSIYISNLWFPN